MSITENITRPDSDGAWNWETTISWYCCACSKELGADIDRDSRTGEPYNCRFCGSQDISYQEWDDDEYLRTRVPVNADPTSIVTLAMHSLVEEIGAPKKHLVMLTSDLQNITLADGIRLTGAPAIAARSAGRSLARQMTAALEHSNGPTSPAYLVRWDAQMGLTIWTRRDAVRESEIVMGDSSP